MKKRLSLRGKFLRFLRKDAKQLAVTIFLLFAFRSAIADWNDVPTGSMKPTIIEGDRIFVNKLAYDLKVPFTTWHLAQWDNPGRGDVVVFFSPADGVRLVRAKRARARRVRHPVGRQVHVHREGGRGAKRRGVLPRLAEQRAGNEHHRKPSDRDDDPDDRAWTAFER